MSTRKAQAGEVGVERFGPEMGLSDEIRDEQARAVMSVWSERGWRG
jgi:hypothetical protein